MQISSKIVISLDPKLSDQVDKLLAAISGQISAADQALLDDSLKREADTAARADALAARPQP